MAFGGFGQSGGFGSSQQQSGGFGGFGASNTNTTGGFGSTNTGFGASNNAPAGSSLFGGNNTSNTGFGGSGFGSNNASTSAFGAPKPAFGAPAATTGGNMFGAANTTTSGSGFGGGFGATNANATPAFGSPANTGGSLFGASKPAFGSGNTGGGLFGGAANTSSTGFGGSANNTSTGFGGSGFGASATQQGQQQQQPQQNNGTATTPFAPHVEKDGTSNANSHYQSITFQQPYANFSFEELRLADYVAGRTKGNSNGQAGAFGTSTGFGGFGGNNTAAPAAGGFGATNTTNTTGGGIFGSNNNNTATSTGFGSNTGTTTGFGGSTGGGLFGANKPATGGLFGSAPPASTATTGGGLFGTAGTSNAGTGFGGGFGSTANNNAGTGGGLFGGNNAAQPAKPAFGGFGQTNTTGGFGASNTGTTGGFGATNNNSTGGLFGGNNNNQQQPAASGGLFGATQPAQSQPAAGGLFGGGGFGQNQNQQPQSQPAAGGGLFGSGGFGQQQPQQQQKPSLFGGANTTNNTGGGLFGNSQPQQQQSGGLFGNTNNNNNQQQQSGGLFGAKPATGGLFGGGASTGASGTGGGLFGGSLGQNNQQQQQQQPSGGLFGGSQQNQQKPGGLFGGLGQSTNNNTGGSLFGGSANNSNTNTGGGLFGSSNNQQQSGGLFGGSQQGQQQNQLSATLLSNPYGNDQLFTNLGTSSTPVGPLATPLAGGQKSAKRPTPLPAFKINPSASLRLITPQKRSNGYGLNYSTYGTPGSGQSFTSNGLGGSLLQSSGLSRSLGKSFSTTNLRNTFSVDDNSSVLAPGAFTPNSRPYAGGSIRRLKIDRNLRTDLFGAGSNSEPSTLNRKRVSFTADEAKGKEPATNGTPQNALVRTEEEDVDASAPGETTNGINGTSHVNGTSEMEQVRGNELDVVPENEAAGPSNQRKERPQTQTDQQPGEYWMSPSIQELRNMSREQLRRVHGYTVGRTGVGKIEFDDVDLTAVPLDEVFGRIVKLNLRSATVYETDVNTPPEGKGLNVPSTITLENSWPRSQAGKNQVHERKGPRFDKHLLRLKRVENTEFISYDPETGVWIFRVQHFTTYGLDDDDDEDDEVEDEAEYAARTTHDPSLHEEESSVMSSEESNPDDTFDFKQGPSKNLPGGFDGDQSIYEDDDMADETDAQDDNESSFLEQRGMSMLEDPFRSSGSGNAAAPAVRAEDRPVDEEIGEQDFSSPEPSAPIMPKSILKQSVLFPVGTLKKDLGLTGDWAEQLQRTVSPKKQDRHALRQRQASVMGAAPVNKAPFSASVTNKAFSTTMDIMNSLWEPVVPTTNNGVKNTSGGKGFEWPYPKRSKIGDASSDMSENDRAFHSSFKPSWANDNTLVYSQAGNSPPVAGNMISAKRAIITESKDIRFAKFNVEKALNTSLQTQLYQTGVSIEPAVRIPDTVTFSMIANSTPSGAALTKHEHAVWKVASILFDPVRTSCESMITGLSDQQIEELEHRIRRDALSVFWSELVREDATTAARNAATPEERALAFLSGSNIEEACSALVEGNDLHLATIVSQLPGDATMKDMMKNQIDAWRTQNVLSEMSEPIRALYEIIAGNVCVSEGKGGASEDRASTFNISSRFGLGWRRSFGLRLWFGNHEANSLADPVHAYSDDIASKKETVRPIPSFAEQEWVKDDSEDTLFGLLKLYARKPSYAKSSSISELLSSSSASGSPLDSRLAWQLATLLRRKGIVSPADVSDETLDSITVSLAAQLETTNDLRAAIKVLLHLTTPAAREAHIRSVLYRYANHLAEPENPEAISKYLTDFLHIPTAWIWHARALYARSVLGDHVAETIYLLRAGAYEEAHTVFCRSVGPQAVISQDHDVFGEVFDVFEAQCDENTKIDDWKIGAQIYFHYAKLLVLERQHSDEQMKEKMRVVGELFTYMPGMLAVTHKAQVDLDERVAVSIMSAYLKTQTEKLIGDEKRDIDPRQTAMMAARLPTTADAGYAKSGMELTDMFYRGITATSTV